LATHFEIVALEKRSIAQVRLLIDTSMTETA